MDLKSLRRKAGRLLANGCSLQVRAEEDPSGTKIIGMDRSVNPYLADQIVWVLRLSDWRGREGGQDCAEALAWVTGNASDRQTGGKGWG